MKFIKKTKFNQENVFPVSIVAAIESENDKIIPT